MGLGRLVPEARAISAVPWTVAYETGSDLFNGSRTWAEQSVDYGSASQLLAVYGAVRFIALHVSTLPLDVYAEDPRTEVKSAVQVPPWLEQPGRSVWLSQMLWSYLMSGDTVAAIVRDPMARVLQLVPVHPDAYEIGYDPAGKIALRVNGQPFMGEALHVPDIVMPGAVRGINPIESARQSIGMGLAAAQFGAKFFGQGTVMSGVLQFPGPKPENAELKIIRDNWTRVHGGSANSHMPGVLFGGAEWKPISIPPEQAQFLETRRFTAAEIVSQVFLLPPAVLGIKSEAGSDITYQNVGSQWDDVMRRLMPVISKFEHYLSALLPPGVECRFNLDAYLRPDAKTRYEAHQIGLDAGFLTLDEVRKIEDLAPLADADRKGQRTWQEVGLPALVDDGIMTPNEARNQLGLPPIAGGDEPRDPLAMLPNPAP